MCVWGITIIFGRLLEHRCWYYAKEAAVLLSACVDVFYLWLSIVLDTSCRYKQKAPRVELG